jgi:hypothetical protein
MTKMPSRPLTETPVSGSVNDEYFYRMLSPYALKLSAPYNDEESKVLEQCLKAFPAIRDMNFIAVGGGELWELRRARQYAKRYVCIEPLADIFINDSVKYLVEQFDDISYISKRFGEVRRSDLPPDNSFFMFLFNILAYVEDPIESINKVLRPGDVLFISTWANTDEARRIRSAYFNHLNGVGKEVVIDPEQTIGLSHLDNFPLEKLTYVKQHERVKGAVTDTLIIYA